MSKNRILPLIGLVGSHGVHLEEAEGTLTRPFVKGS